MVLAPRVRAYARSFRRVLPGRSHPPDKWGSYLARLADRVVAVHLGGVTVVSVN